MQSVVETPAANPRAGDVIPGTGSARKTKYRRAGAGKNRGYRVITYFGGEELPVFLLSVFAIGENANLSQAERNAIRANLAALPENYREGVVRNVKGWRTHS